MSISSEQFSDKQATMLIDDASATVSYIGEAAVSSSPAAAVWRIRKIDSTSGTSILYADGNTFFDNIWNNRAALTYTT